MRRAVLLVTMVGATLLAFSAVVLAQNTTPDDPTTSSSDRGQQRAEDVRPDHYIVLLKDDADSRRVANQHAQQHGAQVNHVYRSAIRGYSAKLSPQALDAIRRDPNVLAVDEDLPQEAFCHRSSHACDTTPPTVSGVSPLGATGVAATTDATATFSEAMNSSTISTTTFYLLKQNTTTRISAAVTYDSKAKKATLNPDADLEAGATYTATVKGGTGGVKDAAGNALAQDKTWQFTTAGAASPPPADTTPPETTIDSGPSGSVSSSTAKFAFSSSEAASTFQCRLDGSPADWSGSACSSPKDYAGLSVGSHTFEVRATDAAGNTDPSPATRTWTVAPQSVPKGVDRIEGDQSSAKAGDGGGTLEANAAVAVIDTGIDYTHPDLNAAHGINALSPDGNQDCATRNQSADSKDDNGHGTHVAGTVGAKDDAQGVVGMAPGAKLYAVKVLNKDGSGRTSDVICGIDWVTANADAFGIKVANMSLGGGGDNTSTCGGTDSYHNAICNSVNEGVTYVVAAGNTGGGFGGTVPATYDEVLTVTAMADTDGKPGGSWPSNACLTDEEDTAANFSSFTNTNNTDQNHTIAAPGVCILSTAMGGGTTTKSGTSMASPHVAGTAALCIASGKCTGGPSAIMGKLRTDAEARSKEPSVSPYYGFKNDPNSPIQVDDTKYRYYGYLTYAGAY